MNGRKSKQNISAPLKDVVGHRWVNINMAQNVLLIWLDSNIDDNDSVDCRNVTIQLRRIVNAINTFTDADQCIDFLTDILNEKIVMIICGALCQHTVPLIHDITQLDTIFIFCKNKTRYEEWAKKWFKVKGVFTEISPICDALEQAVQRCERNAFSVSYMSTDSDMFKKNLDQLDCLFIYTQLLKEILLTIKFEEEHIKRFTDYCRSIFAKNDSELVKVNKFQFKYQDETPIWWYTYASFLYPMLNRALRLMDVDIIIKIGFFIADLHRHIKRLHSEQFNRLHSDKTLTVYRGQGLSKSDFDQMKNTIGGLISFNNFLSTSKNRDISLLFAESNQGNPELIGILFVMTIDLSKSTAPCAFINTISHFQEEDEVLFSMHTVFRICDIKPMDKNHRLFQVDLTLTSDNDKDLCVLADRIREETEDSRGWYRLGLLLLKMGQPDKAQQIFEIILGQTINESEKGNIYNPLGCAKYKQGEYKEAVAYCEKSLEICQKTLHPHHPNVATSYNNIGTVYLNMGEYSKALSSYKKAFEIRQQLLPQNHPDLCLSFNSFGLVYYEMGEFSKALSYYEKALDIRQQSLPPNHPNLAMSYNNISLIYFHLNEHSKAITFQKKALTIQQQSLPPHHPDLVASYGNIGTMYDNMGEYSKALSSHEKALEIQQQSLPSNHPDLAACYANIGTVYFKIDEYSKALLSYEKALDIQHQSLPPNHPDLARCYIARGMVYHSMGEYSKALLSYEKALNIQRQSLPPTHPDLARSYTVHGMVYDKMGEYSKARSFYERAVDIGQHSLPLSHPLLQMYKENLDLVKKKL